VVASLNRPGGNLTGIATLGIELAAKQLDLLHQLVPRATSMGLLVNPENPSTQTLIQELPPAAGALGIELHILPARTQGALDGALASLHEQGAGGLVIVNEALFFNLGPRLAALAAGYAMPAIHVDRTFVAAGGLMSYGTSIPDVFRQAGVYAGRVLKGQKPADLPVQRPTRYELTINLKTAKALGLAVPRTLLARADEVIE
jgi:putative ABC transport system substrate-binding protein